MPVRGAVMVIVALTVVLTGCVGQRGEDAAAVAGREAVHTPASTSTPPSTPTPTATPTPAATPTAQPAPPPADAAGFHGSVEELDEATRRQMRGVSWHPNCPVSLDALRLLEISHVDFDGAVRRGRLVVHAEHAGGLVEVFRQLFEARFPIAQMRPIEEFGGSDDASMAANNTSGFNCRDVPGQQGSWSQHAYGLAVDVNPLLNPYINASGVVMPPEGQPYVDRSRDEPGIVHADGPVVRAFSSVGWSWGGHWSTAKDYQHFSATGR